MGDPSNQAKSIFLAAIENHAPERWPAFLEQACAGNAALRAEVEELLCARSELGSFHEAPRPDLVATIDQPAREAPGTVIGPYKLLQKIGEGGMGTVFMAEQIQPVKRKVALKIIKAGMDTRQVVARFEAERQALAMMDHVNIARVLDAGATENGRPYFVMELVHGVPITKYCDDNHLTPRERLELFVPVCQAIQHAHQKGIIHRDIKPSNVMVTLYDGKPVPKVIDFGVAKATEQKLTERTLFTQYGTMVGTLEYMSPEQAEMSALGIDTRSDIYSLGVLLYELLTGSTPLSRKRMKEAAYGEILRMIKEEEPPKPSTRLSDWGEALASISAQRKTEPAKLSKLMRGELDWIVMKTLEKDRNRRYETANGFAADVQRYLNDETVQACPPSAGYRLRKFARRNKGPVLAASLVLLALLAGIAGTTWGMVLAGRARQAEAERAKTEQRAKQTAERRLKQIEKSNEILTSIFAYLDLRKVKEGTEPLEAVLAHRLVKAAAELEEEAVGDPLVVAGLQHRLSETLLNLGYPREAIPLLVKAHATFTAELGADHRKALASMNDLGLGYRDAGMLDLALPLLEEAVRRRKATLGADDPDTLESMTNLGLAYHDAGRVDTALQLFAETLKLSTARLGAENADTLRCMNNLAEAYRIAGKLDLALPLLEETVRLRKKALGVGNPETLTSMSNLAAAYFGDGKLNLSLSLFEETLKLDKVRLGADHPETLRCMNNLAHVYRIAGKLDLALPLLKETLQLRKAKLGADHPDTFTSMNNLATAYLGAGKLDLALPLCQEAAAGVEKRRFQHEYAGLIVNNLIGCYERMKQFDQAEALRRKWLAVTKERSGVDSAAYVGELAGLGLNLLQQKKWTDAEPVLRECLATREKREPEAWTTFNTQSMLGEALLSQKKYAEAEPLLLQGYAEMKQREAKIPPQGQIRVTEALERLVQLYDAWGKKDKADEWRRKRDSHREAGKKVEKPKE